MIGARSKELIWSCLSLALFGYIVYLLLEAIGG